MAYLQLTIAQSNGVKIGGRRVKLDDFLPEYCKPKRDEADTEEELKAALIRMAKKTGTYHGKS